MMIVFIMGEVYLKYYKLLRYKNLNKGACCSTVFLNIFYYNPRRCFCIRLQGCQTGLSYFNAKRIVRPVFV